MAKRQSSYEDTISFAGPDSGIPKIVHTYYDHVEGDRENEWYEVTSITIEPDEEMLDEIKADEDSNYDEIAKVTAEDAQYVNRLIRDARIIHAKFDSPGQIFRAIDGVVRDAGGQID